MGVKNALLIGINDYDPSGGIPALRFAERDATALADELKKLGFRCRLLVGKKASLIEIKKAIGEIGSGELLLFFFAGHGENVDGHYYLHPYDGELESAHNSLSFNELARHWKTPKLKHDKCVAILDACRSSLPGSGQRGGTGLSEEVTRDLNIARQTHGDLRIFYGCDDGQSCHEYPELGPGHGLLTYHLLQTMRDCSGNSRVVLMDIFEKAADAMRSWQEQRNGRVLQNPTWVGSCTNDRIVLRDGGVSKGAHTSTDNNGKSQPGPTANLVKCALCGKHNELAATFECRQCRRDHLCLNHQNQAQLVCAECVKIEPQPEPGQKQPEKSVVTTKRNGFRQALGVAGVLLIVLVLAALVTIRWTDRPAHIPQEFSETTKSPKPTESAPEVVVARPAVVPAKAVQVVAPPGSYTDSVTGMELVSVPGGCFQMGDTFGDGGSDEQPVHEVCVDGFQIGKYEVTQGQWQKIMDKNPSKFQKGANYPVEYVSWNDAQAFIAKLNLQSGKQFRLPTEAEWEYAARSGGKREKFAGGDNIEAVAWYTYNSGSTTHPVGSKAANGLGIYDMSGNVWEWCQDGYDTYGAGSRTNPIGDTSSSLLVIRGGGWNNPLRYLRASFRPGSTPDLRQFDQGFRLLLPVL